MVKVFLICSGLGNVSRGYESFTQECFEALQQESTLETMLFKGGGNSQKQEFVLPNLPRGSWLTRKLGKLFRQEPYFIEQFTFCLSLLPHIYQKRPDVILFSDFSLGTMLWHLRRVFGLTYKLLFSNGAPNGPPFSRMDCVQHLTPTHYQIALASGESPSKHFFIPYGIKMSDGLEVLSQEKRAALCRDLNLPSDRPILLSVAAINKNHKRIDYLIREVAQLPKPRPYLLMLGQIQPESAEIVELANQLLDPDQFQIKTVASHQISAYYQVADAFVLTSLSEGLPRVLLEAMSHGLPCLAHDYDIARFVLKDGGYFGDFELVGSLASIIPQVLAKNYENSKHQRHQSVYDRFSWDKLCSAYIEMIQHCAIKNIA